MNLNPFAPRVREIEQKLKETEENFQKILQYLHGIHAQGEPMAATQQDLITAMSALTTAVNANTQAQADYVKTHEALTANYDGLVSQVNAITSTIQNNTAKLTAPETTPAGS